MPTNWTPLQRLGAFAATASLVAHAFSGVRWAYRRWVRLAQNKHLRQLYGMPSELVTKKVKDRLDARGVDFIAKSTFAVIASASHRVDVSPRGGPPGFITVLDERRLLLPDRRGNNRLDSLENIIDDGRVQLIFLVPGLGETLRVGGVARLTFDEATLLPLIEKGVVPKAAMEIHITTVYLQCAKAIIRSKLWDSSCHLPAQELPSAAHMLSEQTGLKTPEEMQKLMDEGYKIRLN